MGLLAKENSYPSTMKPIHDDVIIKVENLKVWTSEEKSWWRRRPTKFSTVILNNVTGCIRRNAFAAIIGPSGAGKTTFIVSLAGKCTLPSSGKVTLYGKNVKDCPGAVEIVPQQEVFMDRLSVMEHLAFMTEMKLGSHKDPQNVSVLNALIKEFKLRPNLQTLVSSLSGGERRLLSLAGSLLSDPRVLLCDEPTTGLDSYSALQVIGVLKKLTLYGKTVICSIHQPSSDLFKEFTSILLMAEGKLLYHGTQDEYRHAFTSIGLHCPKNYNPSEFYVRAVSKSRYNIQKLLELYENKLDMNCAIIQEKIQCQTSQRNWFKQVQLLVWRLSLTLKRGVIWDQITQLFITVIITSTVLGVTYAGPTGRNQRDVQNVRGFLWLISSEISFSTSYISLYAFANELSLFRREVGMYQCSAYFVSKLLSYVPRSIVWPIALVGVTTLAMDLPNHTVTALEFIVSLSLSSILSTAYGLGMGALFVSSGILHDVMPCVDLPLVLMSGALLQLSSLPQWLYPVKYISHFYYSMDAISNIYWRQIDYIKCPANATSCVYDGAAVLSGNGYAENFVLQDLLGFFFVTLFWSVLGYFGLKREERKGYAY